jgi:death-on-curing protein
LECRAHAAREATSHEAIDGNIESALARARHRFEVTGAGLLECAARSLFGLAKNHGYVGANKRTAFLAGLTFLRVNGIRIDASPEDVLRLMLDVATDARDESAITEWLRVRASGTDGWQAPPSVLLVFSADRAMFAGLAPL